MSVWLVIVLLFVLSSLGYLKARRLMSPLFISPFIWGLLILCYKAIPHDLYPLNNQFLIAVIIWNVGFFLSALIFDSTDLKLFYLGVNDVHISIRDLFFYLTVLLTPVVCFLLYREAINGSSPFFFLNLRSINTGVEDTTFSLGILSYIFNIALICLFIEICENKERFFNFRIVLLLISNILLSVMTVGRTSFLYLFVGIVICLYFKGLLKARHFLIFFVFLILLFGGLTMMRSFDASVSLGDLVAETLKVYVFSGMPAFDTLTVAHDGYFGANSFRFVYAVMNSLGADVPVSKTIYEYTEVPNLTNVYTVMYPFFVDFGYQGVFFGGFIYGLIYQFFFSLSLGCNKIAVIFFAFLFTSMLLQFFGEYLFTNFSNTLQFLIITILPYARFRTR